MSAVEVENAALEIPEVCEAAVFGVEDSTLGEAIKLCVVPRDGSALSEDKLRKLLGEAPAFKQPKFIGLRIESPEEQARARYSRRRCARKTVRGYP
ncbi:MAG: hypothetical protein MZV70_05510 [Desulfobacterales bacterium]|nr:hypothetical protein [Desulfobacterales bacterium]